MAKSRKEPNFANIISFPKIVTQQNPNH